jgi:hypothetical protein
LRDPHCVGKTKTLKKISARRRFKPELPEHAAFSSIVRRFDRHLKRVKVSRRDDFAAQKENNHPAIPFVATLLKVAAEVVDGMAQERRDDCSGTNEPTREFWSSLPSPHPRGRLFWVAGEVHCVSRI